MNGFKTPILLSIFLFPITQPAFADDVTAGTGNELVGYCNEANSDANNAAWWFCLGVVSGTEYGLESGVMGGVATYTKVKAGPAFIKQMNAILRFCVPTNVTRQQMGLVVSKYLKDHPENLNLSIDSVVLGAFRVAWPCTN